MYMICIVIGTCIHTQVYTNDIIMLIDPPVMKFDVIHMSICLLNWHVRIRQHVYYMYTPTPTYVHA